MDELERMLFQQQHGYDPDEIIDVEPEEPETAVPDPAPIPESAPTPVDSTPKRKIKARKSPLLAAEDLPPQSAASSKPAARAKVTAPIDSQEVKASSAIILNPLADNRKIDKKTREALERKWAASEASTTRGAGLKSIMSTLATKIGQESVFVGDDDYKRLFYGVPVPSIAFEYAIANDVIPLGKPVMIAGAWESGKSALLFEILRWFCLSNGMAQLIDTEHKVDEGLMQALLDYRKHKEVFAMVRSESLEHTQTIMVETIKMMKKILIGTKENPGPGKVIPFAMGLDSFAGAPAQESSDKIMSKGFAERSFSALALSYSQFLPVFVSELANWPFALFIVNHLTQDMSSGTSNQPSYKTKGGSAVNFRESFELHMFRRKRIQTSRFSGIEVEIRVAKNSFGPTGRKITTRMLSWVVDDPETGIPETKFVWDWHYALVKMLSTIEGEAKQRLKDRGVNLFVDPASSVNTPRVRMPALGMAPNEYLPYTEFGAAFLQMPRVGDLVRDALNIRRRPQLIGPGQAVTQQLLQGEYADGTE